jgi:hypothetical protein
MQKATLNVSYVLAVNLTHLTKQGCTVVSCNTRWSQTAQPNRVYFTVIKCLSTLRISLSSKI